MRWHHCIAVASLACLPHTDKAVAEDPNAWAVNDWPLIVATPDIVPLSQTDLVACLSQSAAAAKVEHERTSGLYALIDSVGRLHSVTVTESSGSKTLDDVAAECLRKARFQSLMEGRQPALQEVEFHVRWAANFSKSCTPPVPVHKVIAVTVTPNKKDTDPLAVTGETILCICGKDTGEVEQPIVLRSSGSVGLDDGALGFTKDKIKRWSHPTGCEVVKFVFKRADTASGGGK
jgi:hypothetical protein